MAFGFPASYAASVDLSGDRRNARETVRSIFDLFGWTYNELNADYFTATVPMGGASWGEKFTVTLKHGGGLDVRSVCTFPQIFDWGKNKRNVEAFIKRFSLRDMRCAKTGEGPSYHDSDGKTPLDRALFEDSPDKQSR